MMNLLGGKKIVYIWDNIVGPILSSVFILSASYLLISIAKLLDRF